MKYYVLPLRDVVIQPGITIPLFIERPTSIKTLESAMADGGRILLVTQKDAATQRPRDVDLYGTGTIANIMQLMKLPDQTIKILVEAIQPIELLSVDPVDGILVGTGNPIQLIDDTGDKTNGLRDRIMDALKMYAKMRRFGGDRLRTLANMSNLSLFIDAVISVLGLSTDAAMEILSLQSFEQKLELLLIKINTEIELAQLDENIKNRVKDQIEKNQRDFYLSEKMKAIQKEMGGDEESDFSDLADKIEKANMPKSVRDKAMAELKRLRHMPMLSAESSVIRNYLEELILIPWNKSSDAEFDIDNAEQILNADHDGLEKIKDRILEHLMVLKKTGKSHGSILCFVGPPGVGKTSLGQSIARAMGRVYTRISLGGITDEAHFRGHRKTYIGSQPGRIMDAIKRATVNNPLIMLDEIDKMGRDHRGDPASALLEVLDPEQNKSFRDHYLEVDFDLSNVMFIATANSLDIHPALADRMEIIELSGYIEDEKIKIAKNHLIPRALEQTGLKADDVKFDDDALRHMIRYYTSEAGVRELQRQILTMLRKSLRNHVDGIINFDIDTVEKLLGVRKYKFGIAEEHDTIGVANGLSWSVVGGDLLQIEAITMPGKGNIQLTGQLGDVMKESVQIAKSYIRAGSTTLGIHPDVFEKTDIHVHALEGAVRKDGPSAGITLTTALVSSLTGIPIRRDVAMTGEISLHGRVLPIGGLREKLLGARRAGMNMVLIPSENKKDIADIPEYIYSGMELVFVDHVDDVLKNALVRMPEPINSFVNTSNDVADKISAN